VFDTDTEFDRRLGAGLTEQAREIIEIFCGVELEIAEVAMTVQLVGVEPCDCSHRPSPSSIVVLAPLPLLGRHGFDSSIRNA
jgi:hypothetical protein